VNPPKFRTGPTGAAWVVRISPSASHAGTIFPDQVDVVSVGVDRHRRPVAGYRFDSLRMLVQVGDDAVDRDTMRQQAVRRRRRGEHRVGILDEDEVVFE